MVVSNNPPTIAFGIDTYEFNQVLRRFTCARDPKFFTWVLPQVLAYVLIPEITARAVELIALFQVSHVADIVGPEGAVYAVEFSHRSGRDLINMATRRTNVVPIGRFTPYLASGRQQANVL